MTRHVYPTYVEKSIDLNRFSAPILNVVLLKKGSCHLFEVTFYEPLSSMANNKVVMMEIDLILNKSLRRFQILTDL